MADEQKFLDRIGFTLVWNQIVDRFVKKETGKGLSSNDYTTAEKTKLSGIEEGANKTTVTDSLTSTSDTDALSANKGKELKDMIDGITGDMADLGAGDMLRSVYDADKDGIVDDAAKLGGQLPSYYAKTTDIPSLDDYAKTADVNTGLAKKANTADLATVATTGSYNDLKDQPTGFAPSSHTHEMTDVTGLEDALAGKSNTGHTHSQSDIDGLSGVISNMTTIAQGKCASYVFETVDELDTWLADSANTASLKTGDVFLIRAVDVPDYWWDATASAKQILETTKVELNVMTEDEILEIINAE